MADAFSDGVKSGLAGASAGGAIAAGGAAIGAAAGASLGPFAAIAAPVGAAVGALIGFFVGLASSKPSPQEIAKAKAEHAKAVATAANYGKPLHDAVIGLQTAVNGWGFVSANKAALQKMAEDYLSGPATEELRAVSEQHPAYQPMIDELFRGVRLIASDWANRKKIIANINKVSNFVGALASVQGGLSDDPFAFLRPPLVSTFGPALEAAGINVSDPSLLTIMRGNYDMGSYDFSQPVWSTLGLTTDMNIYGGPTEADRQKAARAAAIFAQSVGAGRPGLATPMMGGAAQSSSGIPTWAYVLLGVGVLGGGYYLLKG